MAINQSGRVKFKTFKCTHDELVSFTAKFEGRRIEAFETISSSISHHDMQLSITGHILVGYRLLKLLFAITYGTLHCSHLSGATNVIEIEGLLFLGFCPMVALLGKLIFPVFPIK